MQKPTVGFADPLERLGGTRETAPAGELRVRVAPDTFAEAARALQEMGARFATLFVAERSERVLTGVFAVRGELVLLRTPVMRESTAHTRARARTHAVAAEPTVSGAEPTVSESPSPESIGAWWPAARWAEQELAELQGVRVQGLDAFTIPYGPVRSGIFEAIQFQIESGGEDVPALQTRPFFKRRGMEARFAGLEPSAAVGVAERTAGIASCAYASAFSQAVERALGVVAPRRAESWRAVHCELERMACHLDVIAKQAETTALYVGQARFQILKERIMRLRARLTGSRFGRGMIVPGGVRADGAMDLDELLGELDELERQLRRDRRMFLGTASMTDRLIGSGRLARALVEEYGAVGPLARGSGVSTDARHERPYGSYRRLGLRLVSARAGDAMARVEVRFGELFESLRLVRQTIDQLRRHDGELLAPLPAAGAGEALAWAEAPQGELLVWAELADGLLGHVHIASPSLRNWALFDHAFPNDVLTDFAFIEHSFGLTPAGADR
jgi:formate hydrogenlyase subunit 5